MIPLEDLIAGLAEAFGEHRSATSAGVRVTDVRLALPIEGQVRGGASLFACMPRGRLATGFDIEHGSLTVHLEERAP